MCGQTALTTVRFWWMLTTGKEGRGGGGLTASKHYQNVIQQNFCGGYVDERPISARAHTY